MTKNGIPIPRWLSITFPFGDTEAEIRCTYVPTQVTWAPVREGLEQAVTKPYRVSNLVFYLNHEDVTEEFTAMYVHDSDGKLIPYLEYLVEEHQEDLWEAYCDIMEELVENRF